VTIHVENVEMIKANFLNYSWQALVMECSKKSRENLRGNLIKANFLNRLAFLRSHKLRFLSLYLKNEEMNFMIQVCMTF
jgi:hypothetical protein